MPSFHRILLLATLATGVGTAVFTSAKAQEEKVLDEIVAKINQDVVTLTDLQKELRLLKVGLRDEFDNPERLEQEYQRRKSGLLKNLIQNRIMTQKAEELGLSANADVEVEAAIENMRKQLGIPSLEVLAQALEQRGTNLQEYRQSIKERMVIDWLVQQSVYSKITLLTPEIEAFYQQNQDFYREPAEVELAEIVVLTEGKTADQARQKANEALQALQSGTSFEEVAARFSEGPTASQGGKIGKFKQGSLAESLEQTVFGMEAGTSTGIIETDYGLQIVKVLSRTDARVRPLEEVRQDIQRRLYQKKAEPELKVFLQSLMQESYIYVAPRYREEYDVSDL